MPVDLKNVDDALDGLAQQMRSAAIRGLQSAAFRGVAIIQSEIIPSRSPQPVDRGIYRAAWRAVAETNGATIENLETVAAFIEWGVRASSVKIGRKMIAALTEWVVRKKIASPEEATSAAWAIAKAMKKRGIFGRGQGLGIMTELVEKRLPAIIQEEVTREIQRVVG